MQPVTFHGCFGWLHAGPDTAAAGTAVVLCQGIKIDATLGHRSLRLLADALARAGYPTLRFDYPGTGDSSDPESGRPGGPEYWSLWQHSVHTAVDWLRDRSGADHVVLCGLRFGAALAATVAECRDDVTGLVLLAPVLRGRSYIRQLIIETGVQSPGSDDAAVELDELQLSGETLRCINRVDLRGLRPRPGCRVIVYAQALSPILSECVAAWTACGAQVAYEDFDGLEPMVRPSLLSHEVPADVARVTRWLRDWAPTTSAIASDARGPAPPAGDAGPLLRLPSCTETPMRFGHGDHLFGMLCRPTGRLAAELVVLIGNSGANPHYGQGRTGVDLARRLSAEGIASLRFDFAGLGDSIARGDATTHVFATDRRADVTAAIDALEALGYERFAVQGICSGAFHMFHAALADPRVGVLLLVNPPVLRWNGDRPKPWQHLPQLARSFYWRMLRQGRINFRGHLASDGFWVIGKAKQVAELAMRRLRIAPVSFAHASMRRLAPRAQTLFLFGAEDEGLTAVLKEFGSGGTPLGTRVRVVPSLSHSVEAREEQRIAADLMIEFLRQEALSSDAAPPPRPGVGPSKFTEAADLAQASL